jgi:hypothetical protein
MKSIVVQGNRTDNLDRHFVLQIAVGLRNTHQGNYGLHENYTNSVSLVNSPVDDDFEPPAWESALFSGIRYAVRSDPSLRVTLYSFGGVLALDDVHDVAVLASNAIAATLNNGRITNISGWLLDTKEVEGLPVLVPTLKKDAR